MKNHIDGDILNFMESWNIKFDRNKWPRLTETSSWPEIEQNRLNNVSENVLEVINNQSQTLVNYSIPWLNSMTIFIYITC